MKKKERLKKLGNKSKTGGITMDENVELWFLLGLTDKQLEEPK